MCFLTIQNQLELLFHKRMTNISRLPVIQKSRNKGLPSARSMAILNNMLTDLQSIDSNLVDVRESLRQIRRKQGRMLQNNILFTGNNHNDLENVGWFISAMKEELSELLQKTPQYKE